MPAWAAAASRARIASRTRPCSPTVFSMRPGVWKLEIQSSNIDVIMDSVSDGEHGVAARLAEKAMEFAVALDGFGGQSEPGIVQELGMHLGEPGKVGAGRRQSGQPRGFGLDDEADFEVLHQRAVVVLQPVHKAFERVGVRIADEDALAVADRELAGDFEDAHGLADGRAADPELGGEVVFGMEFVARRKAVGDDHAPDGVHDAFGKTSLPDRPQCRSPRGSFARGDECADDMRAHGRGRFGGFVQAAGGGPHDSVGDHPLPSRLLIRQVDARSPTARSQRNSAALRFRTYASVTSPTWRSRGFDIGYPPILL